MLKHNLDMAGPSGSVNSDSQNPTVVPQPDLGGRPKSYPCTACSFIAKSKAGLTSHSKLHNRAPIVQSVASTSNQPTGHLSDPVVSLQQPPEV